MASEAEPKRKGKPQRLVKPEKTTPAAQKIIQRNATQSPFLRLSPEIRNRIYSFVLGGNEIHAFLKTYTKAATHSLCVAPPLDDITDLGTSSSVRHVACCTDAWRKTDQKQMLDISLLRVSKQIHQEAALLPFTLNKFTFDSLTNLARFTGSLLVAQRRVLERVSLLMNASHSYVPKQCAVGIQRLRGLKHLSILIENDNQFSNEEYQLFILERALRACVEQFGPLPVRDVDLQTCVIDITGPDGREGLPLPKKHIELVEQYKGELLKVQAERSAVHS